MRFVTVASLFYSGIGHKQNGPLVNPEIQKNTGNWLGLPFRVPLNEFDSIKAMFRKFLPITL